MKARGMKKRQSHYPAVPRWLRRIGARWSRRRNKCLSNAEFRSFEKALRGEIRLRWW